jgi:hypothetical protein
MCRGGQNEKDKGLTGLETYFRPKNCNLSSNP